MTAFGLASANLERSNAKRYNMPEHAGAGRPQRDRGHSFVTILTKIGAAAPAIAGRIV